MLLVDWAQLSIDWSQWMFAEEVDLTNTLWKDRETKQCSVKTSSPFPLLIECKCFPPGEKLKEIIIYFFLLHLAEHQYLGLLFRYTFHQFPSASSLSSRKYEVKLSQENNFEFHIRPVGTKCVLIETALSEGAKYMGESRCACTNVEFRIQWNRTKMYMNISWQSFRTWQSPMGHSIVAINLQ